MSHHLGCKVAFDSLQPPNTFDVSITESFAQLNSSSDVPISRLPNELVQSILARVEMQELIHLRLVCKKWQAVIYSIGNTKKSFCFTFSHHHTKGFQIKKRLFGLINLNNFTNFKLKNNSSLFHLIKLFPNIESIIMDLPFGYILANLRWMPLNKLTTLSISVNQHFLISDYEIKKLLPLINSYISIKRLDLQTRVYSQISSIAPTLEQFSCSGYESSLVRLFGPNCSRVSIGKFSENDNFYQWHTINFQWLTNVTHLQLIHVREPVRVIEYLSQHAISLQVLRFEFACTRMTPQLIGHLAKLKQLTEIDLNPIIFDLLELDAARRDLQLTQLVSIRTCTLSISNLINFTVPTSSQTKSDLFASALSTILPNVEHLNISFDSYEIKKGVDAYLSRFPKLQTHSFK